MSLSTDSLSALAQVAKEVEDVLRLAPDDQRPLEMNRRIFTRLQDQINRLQVVAPNHDGVLAARVKWYGLALDSFEAEVVVPVEKNQFFSRSVNLNYPPIDTLLLAGTETINHFLRRHYLKASFVTLYLRVFALYRRMSEAPACSCNGYFSEQVTRFEGDLLEGRF